MSHLRVSFKGVSKIAVGQGAILIGYAGYRLLLERTTNSSGDYSAHEQEKGAREEAEAHIRRDADRRVGEGAREVGHHRCLVRVVAVHVGDFHFQGDVLLVAQLDHRHVILPETETIKFNCKNCKCLKKKKKSFCFYSSRGTKVSSSAVR